MKQIRALARENGHATLSSTTAGDGSSPPAAAGGTPTWGIVDGLEVVAEMAVEAFELMTGRPAPRRLMREIGKSAWAQGQQARKRREG